jgi:hypothetical protein
MGLLILLLDLYLNEIRVLNAVQIPHLSIHVLET